MEVHAVIFIDRPTRFGTLKMRDMKLRDMKMRHHVAGVENARHENARNTIVWNTACCICMSIAEQECMSRQERAIVLSVVLSIVLH